MRGTEGHPIPFPVKLVRRKACDEARLFIENAAAIEHRSRQHRPHVFARRQWLGRKEDIQPADLRPEQLERELVVRKRQRTKQGRGMRQMPDLVVVVLGVRLPDEDQALAAL